MEKKRKSAYYPREKMRMVGVFLFFWIFCYFGWFQQTVYGQSKDERVTLKFKGISLERLFVEIEKQTSLAFVYRADDLVNQKNVDVDVVNKKVEEVLQSCLKGTGLTFTREGNNILLKRENETKAKKIIEISGKVKDVKGEFLPGVTVLLKGTTLGVVTDTAGCFQLKFPKSEKQVLVFSFLGMETKEIDLASVSDLTKSLVVTLEEDVKAIEEVVVTGYGNFRKTSFTGKAVSVKGEELKKVATRNIISALQVFDPSLRIRENNQFGSDPNALPEFNIRGNSSIGVTGLDQVQSLSKANLRNNTNLPLFIMDGFEVSVEKVYDMDMSRVETINILKDAAATAMYGSRAANGVVVITTVKPKAGEVRVSYNFLAEVSAPDLSDYNLMDAAEKLEAERLAGLYLSDKPNEQIELEEDYYGKLQLIMKGVDTDWLSQPLRNVFNHKHTLYIEGGAGDVMRYGIDFKYDKNNGVMKGSFRKTMGIGLNVEYLLEKLQIRNTVSYNKMNSEESPYGYFSDYSRKQPYDRFKDENGNLLLKTNDLLYNDQNPLYDVHLDSYNKSDYDEFVENLNVNWNIMQGLQLRGTLGVTLRNGSSARFVDPASSKYRIDEDPSERGTLDLTDDKTVSIDGNVMFYLYKMVNDHMFNGNIGINVRQSAYSQNSYSYRGFPLGTMDEVTYAREIVDKPGTSEQTTRLFGYVASLNYSYKDIYLADISGRLDGSSEFGTNNKFAPFWAFGLGLNVHKYKFMENHAWLTRLKVRGSIGQVGKVNFPAYAAMSQYKPFTDWYSTGSASKLVYMGNPDLKWEITKTKDLGVEIGLFPGERLFFDFSYYNKHTHDLITTVTIPTSSGFKEYRDNMGEIINEGFEVDMRATLVRNQDMTLVLMGNLGHNKNTIGKISASLDEYNKRVEELLNEQAKTNIANSEVRYEPIPRYVEGGSTTSIFAMKSAGIDPANGREKYIRRDGTSTYDYNAVDEVIVGDELPDIQGSFGVNFYYKGFSLYATFMYEVGAQKYNSTLVNAVENADISYSNVDKRVLYDRWIKPGDRTPLKDIKTREYTTKPTSRFVQDDNWLSLSYFSIGYDLNQKLLKKIVFSQCNFQLSTSSPFRWSSIKRERGLSYPYARTYNFTMNLVF